MRSSPSSLKYDVIVIGVGAMGAATCYYLAKKGQKVLGLDQFEIGHEMGSHGGQSRIIRKAYFEHPDYVPLLERAYENWEQLEADSGEKIYHQTGLLYFGPPGNEITGGVLKSASLYNLLVFKLTQREAKRQFHQFNFGNDFEIVYEPEAGFLTPEKAIRTYAIIAGQIGARILENEPVKSWKMKGDSVLVKTNNETYEASKLVITAGAWSSILIPGLHRKLKVTKQALAWTMPTEPDSYALGKFPCWLMKDPDRGPYYGFPMLDPQEFGDPFGLKSAHHFPAEQFDPTMHERPVNENAEEDINFALSRWLPNANEKIVAMKSCLYTNTPDEHFIIDHLPGHDGRVTIACGFSGHGFKFASVMGEILADLAIKGETRHPVGFLGLNRFEY